jgi:cytochrome c biogenesis protein CcdA
MPVALAMAAGMLAAVNPCGFALLPAYLSLLVVGDDAPGRPAAVARALGSTAAMTAGFVGVFGLFGLVVAPAAGAVQQHLPWAAVGFGLLLAGLGGWLVAGRQLPGPRLRRGPAVTRSPASMALFGAGYAVASLGCTIGPFLAIVAASFRAGSPLAGAALFVGYAAGMGLVVAAVALAVALSRSWLVGRLRRAAPVISRLGGALLVLAGGYVAYYGWYEVRVLHGGSAADPVVDGAGVVQRWLAGGLDRLGVPVVAAVFGLLLGGALAAGWAHRRTRTSAGERR